MKITPCLYTLFIACILNTNAEPTTAAPGNSTDLASDESLIGTTTAFDGVVANGIGTTDIDTELLFATTVSGDDSLDAEATEITSFDDTDVSGDDDESDEVDTDDDDEDDMDLDLNDSDDSVECEGLTQTQCTAQTDEETGDAECAFNRETGDCYSITRAIGDYGSGGYDDGYVAAKDAAKKASSQLYTIVGILGGVIGVLIIVLAGGGYYFYNKSGISRAESQTVQIMAQKVPVLGQSMSIPHDHDQDDTAQMIV